MESLRKDYSHFVGGWSLARKAAWALSGCMKPLTIIFLHARFNGWAWLKVTGVSFGWKWPGYGFSGTWTEVEIGCVKSMHKLNGVPSVEF